MKKEFGKWLADIAKYVFTAVVVSTFFANFSGKEKFVYVVGMIVVTVFLFTGLQFQKEEVKKKKKRRK